MTWIFLAIAGYFIYAAVTVVNKFLLRQPAVTRPLVFTFWVGVLSIFTFVLAPFGLHWPGLGWFLFDLAVGVVFFFSLLTYYKSLDDNEASRAASVVGGLTPVLVLLLAFIFLGERFSQWQFLAFLFLVVGGFLISLERDRQGVKESLKGIKIVVLAIILGAVYWVLAKFIFDQQGFITGFVWMRLGLVFASLAVLLWPRWRRTIFSSIGEATGQAGTLMIAAKGLAAFGSLFVHWALALGSAALVNAMQGTEYVFLLFLVVIFSKKFPDILREKITRGVILQKSLAVILIVVGLGLLAL